MATAKAKDKKPKKLVKKVIKPAKKQVIKKPVKAPVKSTKVAAKKTPAKSPVVKKEVPKKASPKKVTKPVAPKKESGKKTAPKKLTPTKPMKAIVPPKKTTPEKIKTKMPAKEEKPRPPRRLNTPGSVIVPPDYKPKEKEEFMNPVMAEYFRLKLLRWKADLLREAENTVQDTLQGTELQKPDLVDRASEETDHALELRTRDRERKLIGKIDEALLRVEDGSYGYCEETGEPISVGRLDARPIATLSLEAQERHERKERTQRDD